MNSLKEKLDSRVAELNAETADVADKLRKSGATEGTLAAFLSMHSFINRMISNAAWSANTEVFQKYVDGLQFLLRGLRDALLNGSTAEEVQAALADRGLTIASAVREALKGVTQGRRIGPAGAINVDERKL